MSEPQSEPSIQPSDELRYFSEKIISGEFQDLVILMVLEDGFFQAYHGGSTVGAIGMCEYAKMRLTKKLSDAADNEQDEEETSEA